MQALFLWVMTTLKAMGYTGIILLMALESSIVPVPSELIVPPAAYWAAQGTYSMWAVIACATFGSWLGAAISYWVSRAVGKPLIVRYGKWVLLSPDKLEMGERWVERYGTGGIFLSRLLPVVRHLISIPAGILDMNFARFSLMTVAGSFIWCSVLAWFGSRIITPPMLDDPNGLMAAVKGQMHWIVLLIVLVSGLWALMKYLTRK